MARWQGDKPVVSILCPTYQHVGFIEDALRGFLGQNTNFPFEILVRDDASTDGTADIVRDYAERYPNIIRAILETENRYPAVAPQGRLASMAKGEFIATCEGDDYWLDPDKIQQQVDTLRTQPAFVASHHPAMVVEDSRIWRLEKRRPTECRSFTAAQLEAGGRILTLTILRRAVPIRPHLRARFILNGDEYLRTELGKFGGAVWQPDIAPAVYRRHAGGIWAGMMPVEQSFVQAQSFFWIGLELRKEGRSRLSWRYLFRSANRLVLTLLRLSHKT